MSCRLLRVKINWSFFLLKMPRAYVNLNGELILLCPKLIESGFRGLTRIGDHLKLQ